MRAEVRRKLKMVGRVREFCRSHPSQAANAKVLIDRLEERLTRADALVTQQRSGRIMAHAATLRRDELRRALQLALLPYLVKVGESAAREVPDLRERFQLPKAGVTNPVFLNAVRAMLDEALSNRDPLLKNGLEEGFLEVLEKTVTELEAVTESGHTGRREHVGASADLETVTVELMELVGQLDAQTRYRFRNDAENLAAWKSARNVVGPFKGKDADAPEGEGGTPPNTGGVAPAA